MRECPATHRAQKKGTKVDSAESMNQKPKRCLQVAYDQCINEPVPFAALDDVAQA